MAYIDFSVGNAKYIVPSSLNENATSILLSKKQFVIDKGAQGGDFIPMVNINEYYLYSPEDIKHFEGEPDEDLRFNNSFASGDALVWGIPPNIRTSMLIVGIADEDNFNVSFTVDLDIQEVNTERAYWLKQLIISVSGR